MNIEEVISYFVTYMIKYERQPITRREVNQIIKYILFSCPDDFMINDIASTIIFIAVAGSPTGIVVVQPVLEDKTTPPNGALPLGGWITGIEEKTVWLRHVRNL